MNRVRARYTMVLILAIFVAVSCFAVILFTTPTTYAEEAVYVGTYTYGVTYRNLEANLKENGELGGYYELDEKYLEQGQDILVEGGKIGRFEFDATFSPRGSSESRKTKVYINVEKRTPILRSEAVEGEYNSEYDLIVDLPNDLSATYGDLQSTLADDLPKSFSITEGDMTVGNAGKRYIPIMYTPEDTEHYKMLSGTYYSNSQDYAYNQNCTVGVDVAKADYDMSAVKFDDATVYFTMGDSVNIGVSGTLPEGVSVTYEGNGVTSEGQFTVTAKFMGDVQNYNSIPNMSATLTTVMTAFSMVKGSLSIKIYSTTENQSVSSLVNVNISLTEDDVSEKLKRYSIKINSIGTPNGEYYIDMQIIGLKIGDKTFAFDKIAGDDRVSVTDYEVLSDSLIRFKDTSFGNYILELKVEAIDTGKPSQLWWIIPIVLGALVIICGGVALLIIHYKKKESEKSLSKDDLEKVVEQEEIISDNEQIEKSINVIKEEKVEIENKVDKSKTSHNNAKKKKKNGGKSKQQYLGKKKN